MRSSRAIPRAVRFASGDAAHLAKGSPGHAVELVRIGDDGDHANRKLRSQAETAAHIVVGSVMQIVGSKRLAHPRLFADEVRRIVVDKHGPAQGVGLFWRRLELDLRNELHTHNISL